MSIAEVSKTTGILDQSLRQFETDSSGMSLGQLQLVVDALGIDLLEAFKGYHLPRATSHVGPSGANLQHGLTQPTDNVSLDAHRSHIESAPDLSSRNPGSTA